MNAEPFADAPSADGPPRVLVVDDTPGNRRLYASIMRDAGAEPALAESGAQALALLSSGEFAMILLDVHLPDMDGFELARRLRAERAGEHVPILFISAVHTLASDAGQAHALGAVDYLMAPIAPDVLRAKSRLVLELFQARKAVAADAARLAQAHDAVQEAYAELDAFNYSVSHDLRNPMHAADGLSRLLLQDPAVQASASARELAEGIVTACRRMNLLIESLMQLSRVGRMELHPESVNLSALARDVATDLARHHPERAVRWQIADDLRATGDLRMLQILLANLIGNAWKYSSRRDDASIRFDTLEDNGEQVFYVRDNGVGFDPQAARDRLFKPFRRLHTEREFEGTGVGLATAQRIVRRHHGRIWAEAQTGQGATFFFILREEPQWRLS